MDHSTSIKTESLEELLSVKMSKELPRHTCQTHAHDPSRSSMAHGRSTGSSLSSSGLSTEQQVIPRASDTASAHWEGSHKNSSATLSLNSAGESTTFRKRQPRTSSSSSLTSSTPATPFDSTARREPAAQRARAGPVLSPISGSVEALTSAAQHGRTHMVISDPNRLQLRAPVKSRNLASLGAAHQGSSAQSAYPDLHRLKVPTSVSGGLAFDTKAAARNKSQQAARNATRVRHQYTPLSISSDRSAYPAWARVGAGLTLKQSIASSFLTLIANILCGLLICLHTCMRVVMAPAGFVFAACISSQPPWAASSPVESWVRPQRPFDEDCSQLEDTRRPSTEDEWIAEALLPDYGFRV